MSTNILYMGGIAPIPPFPPAQRYTCLVHRWYKGAVKAMRALSRHAVPPAAGGQARSRNYAGPLSDFRDSAYCASDFRDSAYCAISRQRYPR